MISRDDAVAIIEKMIASWEGGVETSKQAVLDLCAPGFTWRNTGYPDVVGHDAAAALWDGAAAAQGLQSIETEVVRWMVDMPNIAVERIDRMIGQGGRVLATLPIVGVFAFDEAGKIAYWGDYTDPSAFVAHGA